MAPSPSPGAPGPGVQAVLVPTEPTPAALQPGLRKRSPGAPTENAAANTPKRAAGLAARDEDCPPGLLLRADTLHSNLDLLRNHCRTEDDVFLQEDVRVLRVGIVRLVVYQRLVTVLERMRHLLAVRRTESAQPKRRARLPAALAWRALAPHFPCRDCQSGVVVVVRCVVVVVVAQRIRRILGRNLGRILALAAPLPLAQSPWPKNDGVPVLIIVEDIPIAGLGH